MEQQEIIERRGITGNTLKMIAVLSMLVDHVGAVVIERVYLNASTEAAFLAMLKTGSGQMWYRIDMVLRTVGRIAFPIFCFLLVEGFLHTRNVKKYAGRLLVFALVSEIPFDLAVFGTWLEFSHQNVFFTLFVGLMVLEEYKKSVGSPVRQAFVILIGCGAASFLRCDYDMAGVVLILLLYVFWDNKRLQTIFGGLLAAFESLACFGAGMLSFIPIRMYNGKRGGGNLKYFFYWFYPVHLLALFLLRVTIFGIL